MSPFIQKVLSFLVYRQEASNDHLEAYPERLHVAALPERRYLKTSRFFVIATLLSLTLNFALCFFYIRNAKQIETLVDVPNRQDTFLYNLDYYNKELKPVEKPFRYLGLNDLLFQNLISDYLNQRYQMTSNGPEMLLRWGTRGKVAAYAPKLYEDFQKEAEEALTKQARGLTQEIYIYSIKNLNGSGFYEVIFDVFTLNESGYGAQKCPCRDKTKECLTCMRDTATTVKRYKAYMDVTLLIDKATISEEQIRQNINPYYFLVNSIQLMQQELHPNNMWENVDLILE